MSPGSSTRASWFINIRYGTCHPRDLLDPYDGNLIAALAACNAGSGNAEDLGL